MRQGVKLPAPPSEIRAWIGGFHLSPCPKIVHFQRFGEALRMIQDELDSKNFYAVNLAFPADFNKE